jgi:hypothetical protein
MVLLLPRFALLKEWAYAGATFAWVDGVHLRLLGVRCRASMEPATGALGTPDCLLRDQASEPPIDFRHCVWVNESWHSSLAHRVHHAFTTNFS